MTTITTKLETVTPEKATEWLDLGGGRQRKYNKWHALRLAEQIRTGNWRINGESIKFSDSGRLLDGQHRLHAVFTAKRAIETFITRGLPEEIFDSLDQGKKRTVADVLGMNGEASTASLASAISLVRAIAPVIRHERPPNYVNSFHQSPIDAEAFLKSAPRIRKSCKVAHDFYTKLIRPSTIAGLHWIFGQTETADRFAQGMAEGFVPSAKDQQALHLFREAMIANKIAHTKMRRHIVCALAIKALNAAQAGETLKELTYERDEPFPIPTVIK